MIVSRLRAARQRDEGFALIFVLLVTTMVMILVAGMMSISTPNIVNAKHDQDRAGALLAAQAGIDDVVSYLLSLDACRSTTRVCSRALGADSVALQRPQLGTRQTFHWTTDSTLTADGYVRVRSAGTVDGVTQKLVADIALAPSILSFGYYTDYESQAPDFLYQYFDPRRIYIEDPDTYGKINAYTTSGKTLSVSSPITWVWNGPPTTGTNPLPAKMCGQHWYYDSASSPGRYSYGSSPVWGENGSPSNSSSTVVTRTSSCDVVFTTGMTFDGPIYSRDALLISDATVGGVGPIFKQPVSTLWGFKGHNTPVASTGRPWRSDASAGGNISTQSPYSPAIASLDLQLPTDIGTTGLADDACVYRGPTRVKLNNNGTATITSPETTAPESGADPRCYPSGSFAGGIVGYTLQYKPNAGDPTDAQHNVVGHGTLYVKNTGSEPSTGWPGTGIRSTTAITPSNAVFYVTAKGGATVPDQADNSAAVSSTCSSTVKYANTASWPCAWTGVATNTDVGSGSTGGSGWTAYTSTTKCNVPPAGTDRQLFECEYSHTTGNNVPSTTNNYGSLRSTFQSQLSSGTCLTGTTATQGACLAALMNGDLKTANTGQHAYNFASPAVNDHRYSVTTTAVGTSSQGTARSVGSAPTAPMAGDGLFSTTSAVAQEAATKTPITLTVTRQTYGCINAIGAIVGILITLLNGQTACSSGSLGWGATTPQFTTTVTQSDWSITQAGSATSYFPNTNDVTQYNRAPNGTLDTNNQPGDLYVEGNNQGNLSLIAQNDVVVTGDIQDTSSDSSQDAVDIVAGNNVRNYHPVQCDDQTAGDINATDPGWCPNDITGLYRGTSMENNGVLTAQHPAKQYDNMLAGGARRIDAAIFALAGSFLTDNYNRGDQIGTLTVNGGLYQSHRGANGVQWEYQQGDTKRANSGYSLQYHYVDLQHSGLPYAPPATGGSNTRVWNVVSVSAG